MINRDSITDIDKKLWKQIKFIQRDGFSIPVLQGAVVLEDFIAPETRQLVEGQIYSHGEDLTQVYKTSRAGRGVNELCITKADQQIPMIGDLASSINIFLEDVFDEELKTHAYQLRELAPKSSGHPRHVDYANGFDIKGDYAITSVSLSLPISWNNGVAPDFIMETKQGNVVQDKPGSLGIFGPQIMHSHPPTDDLENASLWLVTQAFFKMYKTDSGSIHSDIVKELARKLDDKSLVYEAGKRRINIALDQHNVGILQEVESTNSLSTHTQGIEKLLSNVVVPKGHVVSITPDRYETSFQSGYETTRPTQISVRVKRNVA